MVRLPEHPWLDAGMPRYAYCGRDRRQGLRACCDGTARIPFDPCAVRYVPPVPPALTHQAPGRRRLRTGRNQERGFHLPDTELPPSAAELETMCDAQVIDLIVKANQPGNSALAEMQRRTSKDLVCAVKAFDEASTKQAAQMRCLTFVILMVAIVQVLLLVFN